MAQYQSILTGPEIDAALQDMAQHNSEAWAVGQRDGVNVTALDVTYQNNAKYYSDNAQGAAARAEAAVPASTAGAVFFDRAQTLTDAQKTQARTNIGAGTIGGTVTGGILQLTDSGGNDVIPFAAATIEPTNIGNWTYAGFARLPKNANINYGEFIVGGYDSASTSNTPGAAIIQLRNTSNVLTMTVTKLTPNAQAATFGYWDGGDGYWYIGVYAPGYRFPLSVIPLVQHRNAARRVEFGYYYSYSTTAPTGWTAVAASESPNNVIAIPAETNVGSIAALKTQLSAWATAQGRGVGFYLVAFTAASSPFVAGARVNIQLNLSSATNGVATLTTYGSSAAEMYLMRLYNSTWGDPKKVTVAS